MPDYPSDIEVETPLGPVFLTVTDGDSVYVDASGRREPLVVNGVPLNVSLHLADYGHGFEPRRDSQGNAWRALSASRTDEYRDASDAARRRILAVLVPVVNDFMRRNPYLRDEGQEARRAADISSLETEIAKLEDDLAERRGRLADLVRGG